MKRLGNYLRKRRLKIDVELQIKDNKNDLEVIKSDLKRLEKIQDVPNSEYAKQADNWHIKFLELKEKRLIQREKLLKLKKEIDEL